MFTVFFVLLLASSSALVYFLFQFATRQENATRSLISAVGCIICFNVLTGIEGGVPREYQTKFNSVIHARLGSECQKLDTKFFTSVPAARKYSTKVVPRGFRYDSGYTDGPSESRVYFSGNEGLVVVLTEAEYNSVVVCEML